MALGLYKDLPITAVFVSRFYYTLKEAKSIGRLVYLTYLSEMHIHTNIILDC